MEIKIGAFPVQILTSTENQKCAPIAGEFQVQSQSFRNMLGRIIPVYRALVNWNNVKPNNWDKVKPYYVV